MAEDVEAISENSGILPRDRADLIPKLGKRGLRYEHCIYGDQLRGRLPSTKRLEEILREAAECWREEQSEAAWNSAVHDPLLSLARRTAHAQSDQDNPSLPPISQPDASPVINPTNSQTTSVLEVFSASEDDWKHRVRTRNM